MTPRQYWLGWMAMAALFLATKLVDWYLLTRR
jgi:hypothetical protein